MKCDEFEKSNPHHHKNLENLDKALHDLGMLSAITEARREYLKETKTNIGVVRLNTRFVSNVTVGYCMKKTTIKNRLCPYLVPVRHRTKSENSDSICNNDFESEPKYSIFEPSTSGIGDIDIRNSTKRCQSLENINLLIEQQPAFETSPEMDCVSNQIEKLQVDE
ncbi:uncharacterized protein LOC126966022 [Leptidea sinapis]|uniref:uncharacterized protein LOC126966022 n=1 Tax=Leptidea sinapis TaxID=189913 RepID=UPI0021239691|nr:uncharacterized protein LOC126966022 [Leptidea sinapis]